MGNELTIEKTEADILVKDIWDKWYGAGYIAPDEMAEKLGRLKDLANAKCVQTMTHGCVKLVSSLRPIDPVKSLSSEYRVIEE